MFRKYSLLIVFLLFASLIPHIVTAQEFNPPEWGYNNAIYEVNLRQYTEEGTIKAVEKHLPRLKELGADIYSKLFQLKKNNKALQNGALGGEMNYIKSSDEKNIFAFSRSSEKDKVVAVFNLSNEPVRLEVSGETLAGSYKNYFTGKLESFSTVASFKLNPWEYRVYTK